MRKLFLNIYTFFFHLFYGLHSADKIAFSGASEEDKGDGSIEVKDEAESVYKDLLKGEITQEVKELRHEMYFSERGSYDYEYAGGGRVKKRNVFDSTPDYPCEDGYKIQIVQSNMEDTDSLAENLSEEDYRLKNEREYTISIEREFIPRFRIEEFTNKIVVERGEGDDVIIDLYVTKYESQFNRRHKPFLNEIERIKNGDTRSEIIDFDRLKFITYKAWGANDLMLFSYYMLKYRNISEYNGDYIISFTGKVGEEIDITNQFYDNIANKKSENHEARNSSITINYMDVLEQRKNDTDSTVANDLIQKFKEKDV